MKYKPISIARLQLGTGHNLSIAQFMNDRFDTK